MLKGEIRCGTSLFDFSVLGSLTEKSSDLVQMSPWSLNQGGSVPMQSKNKGVVGTSSSPVLFGVCRWDFFCCEQQNSHRGGIVACQFWVFLFLTVMGLKGEGFIFIKKHEFCLDILYGHSNVLVGHPVLRSVPVRVRHKAITMECDCKCAPVRRWRSVSYTHLDVYKRQV